jgi:hypothetical protein
VKDRISGLENKIDLLEKSDEDKEKMKKKNRPCKTPGSPLK